MFIPEDLPRIAWALDPNWPRDPAGQESVATTQVPVAPVTVGPEEEAVAQEVVEEVVEEVVAVEGWWRRWRKWWRWLERRGG